MSKRPATPPEVKAHPDYSDGYFAGLNDQFHRGESPEYEAGYANGQWARELFESKGLSRTGDGEFRIKLTLGPGAPS